MIKITRHKDGISLIGHAQYAEHGQDIVCAGVSTLVQTLIQSLDELVTDTIQYDMSPGMVDIKHGLLSENARLLIDAFMLGAETIAENYPQNVQIKRL